MNPSRSKPTRSLAAAVALALACGAAGADVVRAQTPDATCAADSLYLISPPELRLRLQESPRPGVEISWQDLDQSLATCYTLREADDLGFAVDVSGGFGDRVDRVLRFEVGADGAVGANQTRTIFLTWYNEGADTYGHFSGQLNLTNNGGFWSYDPTAGTWSQLNEGLPMNWRYVNVRALARGSGGFMVAALTRGNSISSNPEGLWVRNGAAWRRIAADLFTSSVSVRGIAVSPLNNAHFAVATAASGLFVTNDGGQTFTQWRGELDPTHPAPPATFAVGAVSWSGARLLASVNQMGVYYSEDNGASFQVSPFQVPSSLDLATPIMQDPQVNSFSVDPDDANHLLASLQFHGVYESTDGARSWHDMYGNLLVSDPLNPGAWSTTAMSAVVVNDQPQTVIMAVRQRGLYRTTDGGQTWSLVGAGQQPAAVVNLLEMSVVQPANAPGTVYVLEDGYAMLRTSDGGVSWETLPNQTTLRRAQALAVAPGGDDLVLGNWNGGVFLPGSTVALGQTYDTGTSDELLGVDIGLDLTVGAGPTFATDRFAVVAQTFQGWAVWQAPSHDAGDLTLLGLYDRVNPEDCIEGYCGDRTYEVIPQCFAAKRAACFNFDTPDTIRFFDDEVHNGFAYYYAVTSYDYGNTAMLTPGNNVNDMLFSKRYPNDGGSPFAGDGNLTYIMINESLAPDAGGDEIYAFPNPVRLGSGIPRAPGEMVVFTNLPAGARVRIFTAAGDDVINLGPDNLYGGQMYWTTANRHGEQVAAGVYLYKVEMPQRADYWGRIVVIR